jgi:hypothetical protein
MGITPFAFMERRRMEDAVDLLAGTSMTVRDVGVAVSLFLFQIRVSMRAFELGMAAVPIGAPKEKRAIAARCLF